MLGSMFLPSKINYMKVYGYIDIVLTKADYYFRLWLAVVS